MINQVVRYELSGIVNGGIDFLILNLLVWSGISLFWSVFWGYLAGSVMAFFTHGHFTFKYDFNGNNHLKFAQYIIISAINLVLTEWIVHLGVSQGFNYNLAKALALLIGFLISFSSLKLFIFRK